MKMKKNFGSVFRLLAVAMLPMMAACTENLELEGTPQSESSEYMSFAIQDDGENWTRTAITRGAQATTGSLSAGFGVSASVYPKAGTYTSYGCGSYFYNIMAMPLSPTAYFWPTDDYEASFYAYYPYGNSAFTLQSSANQTGAPTYAYTVPQAIASQVDVMTAQITDHLCGPQDALSLSFGHRCTDIRFTAYNQQNDALTITSVSVYGVKYSGTWTSGTSWTLTGSVNSSSSYPFILAMNANVASEATVDLTGTANHFIMLPQTIAAGTDLFVITTIEDGDPRTYTYTLPSATTWEMGKSYTYAMTLGNGNLTVSSVTVVDWQAVTPLSGTFSVNNWAAQ